MTIVNLKHTHTILNLLFYTENQVLNVIQIQMINTFGTGMSYNTDFKYIFLPLFK